MERRNQLRYQTHTSTPPPAKKLDCQITARGQTLEHHCLDISANGIGIISQSYLNVGQVVEIELNIHNHLFQLKGLVCNRRQTDAGHRLGISFALIPQQHQKIQQLLTELKLPLTA